MTYTLIAWALQPRKWTKGHQVLSSNLAWATIQWQRTGTSSVKTRCGLRVPLPAAGPLNGDLFTIVYYADEAVCGGARRHEQCRILLGEWLL